MFLFIMIMTWKNCDKEIPFNLINGMYNWKYKVQVI